jgi:ribose 5-phosphate isomerase
MMSTDDLKRQAAARAVEQVRDGMKLGLGTGSTAKHFVELLGERVKAGLTVVGVPTSEATRADAERCGVPLTTLEKVDRLDLTVDGADEVDPNLELIKGGGGALLREKIVAAASDRMIVIADETKWVETLGRFPLPIEVIPFGLGATRRVSRPSSPKTAFPGRWIFARRRTATFSSLMAATGLSMPGLGGFRIPEAGGITEFDSGRSRAWPVYRPRAHGRAGRSAGYSRC